MNMSDELETNNSNAQKERRHLYFNLSEDSQFALQYFDKFRDSNKSMNPTEWLGQIFKEYELLKANQQSNEELSVMIADELTTKLRPLFLRTSHADKNTRVVLEILNGMLFQNQYQDIVTTNEMLTTPMKKAIQKVDSDIESVIRRNTEKKTDGMTNK